MQRGCCLQERGRVRDFTHLGLFAAGEAFVFFQHVQIHVVAHIAFRGQPQGLVVPRVIGTVAQSFVDHPAAGLGLADFGIIGGDVPALCGLGPEMGQNFGGAGIGIGYIFGKMIEATARQPAAEAKVGKYMWIGFALVEAIALYGLVIAFIIMGLRG